MASDDFYSYSAKHRLQQLEVSRAQALADLQQARAGNDYESAGSVVEELAKIEAAKSAIVNLHQQYVASQYAPEPPELTPEEKHAKPWDRMTLEDGLDLARTSKYGKDLDFNAPNVIAGYHHMIANRGK